MGFLSKLKKTVKKDWKKFRKADYGFNIRKSGRSTSWLNPLTSAFSNVYRDTRNVVNGLNRGTYKTALGGKVKGGSSASALSVSNVGNTGFRRYT